jgi:predicted Zn-dependent peptidase
LALVAEVATEPALMPEEVETERRLLLGQIHTRLDTPFSHAMDTLMKDLFGAHPYALPTGGERANIERITREELRTHHATV